MGHPACSGGVANLLMGAGLGGIHPNTLLIEMYDKIKLWHHSPENVRPLHTPCIESKSIFSAAIALLPTETCSQAARMCLIDRARLSRAHGRPRCTGRCTLQLVHSEGAYS